MAPVVSADAASPPGGGSRRELPGSARVSAARELSAARGRGTASRSPVLARHGMVCAAQPLAVQAGLGILERGGGAADPPIARKACLGLLEPTANGRGRGL